MQSDRYIPADWPASSRIHAYTSTRVGGNSLVPFDSFNLADHVGDELEQVTENRSILISDLQLPHSPTWIQQTHSTTVVKAHDVQGTPEADASTTDQPKTICAVLTADCLPLLVCNRQGNEVAAIHAGWRGLADGIIENTINTMTSSANDLYIWLGPAIGPTAFEVGADVHQAFIDHSQSAESAFQPINESLWLADIYQLARQRLEALGVQYIYGGNFCTYSDSERFFSYRRANDGKTGRMVSLIWFD